LLGLSACVPAATRSCPTELTCVVSQALAADLAQERGRVFGPGVVLGNSVALGPTVLTDIHIAARRSDLTPREIAKIQTLFATGIGESLCAPDESGDIQVFFDIGGDLRYRMLDISSIPIADATLRSCRG
jgi:hypothetical protein